eukprot:UC1_evm2s706
MAAAVVVYWSADFGSPWARAKAAPRVRARCMVRRPQKKSSPCSSSHKSQPFEAQFSTTQARSCAMAPPFKLALPVHSEALTTAPCPAASRASA